MGNFKLTVTVENDTRVRAITQAGAESKGEVKLDDLRRKTIAIFVDWLNQGKVSQRRELEVLGRLLYEALFNGEMATFFELCLGEARKAKERLVVLLSFEEEAADLADLPWEYLYNARADSPYFLSTHIDLVLSRYVSPGKTSPQEKELEKSPLRILIVFSNAEGKDLMPVGAEQVVQVIKEEAGRYPIQIDILDKPTINNFLEKIDETKPHVVHFIGYGRFNNKEKVTEIALLDDDEKSARWVKDDEFAYYFVQMHWFPRLVLLHLCESATTMNSDTFTASFSRLAPQLTRANVPAVVAMQYPLPNNAAVAFSKVFYRALAKGESIDTAVQDRRWRITTSVSNVYDNRMFCTPVLYARNYGGIILPVEGTPSTQPKPEATSSKLPKVQSMMSDIPTNPPSRLTPTEDLSIQSTGNLSTKQDVVSFVEPGQTKSGSNGSIKTDPNRFSRLNLVRTIISAGENKMAKMLDLTKEREDQITQTLSTIRDQLYREANADDMKVILLGYLESDDRDFRGIIWSMIDALGKK
jgi:CHAT domain